MNPLRILNLGAGIQSTAVYLLGMDREIEPFDLAIFSDTGEEPAAVYRHLEWLESLGGPPILRTGVGRRLGDDLIHGSPASGRFASIPAFIRKDGEVGLGARQCTAEYKIQPIERCIRREVLGLAPRKRIPKGVEITQVFGLSFDEPRRVIAVKARFQGAKPAPTMPLFDGPEEKPAEVAPPRVKPEFPLFHDLRWERGDCVSYLQEKVPHEVPRSACVCCPYRGDREWRRLAEEAPEEFGRAIQIDEALRDPAAVASKGWEGRAYLHRSCKPLAEQPFREDYPAFQGIEQGDCEGMCGL